METMIIEDAYGNKVPAIYDKQRLYSDYVHIIHKDTYVKLIQNFECGDVPVRLDECLDKVGYTDGTVIVICEEPLRGTVLKYGNHGKYWEEVGNTRGYA